MDLSAFPLPSLVKIAGPVSPAMDPPVGQDRESWWGYTESGDPVAIPPAVVDEMMAAKGVDVWNPLPNEVDPLASVERVRQELNAAAERIGNGGT